MFKNIFTYTGSLSLIEIELYAIANHLHVRFHTLAGFSINAYKFSKTLKSFS